MRNRARRGLFALAVLVAACQGTPAGTAGRPAPHVLVPTTASVRPATSPSQLVTASHGPFAPAASNPAPRGKLIAPQGAVPVSGRVVIDAAYLIANNSGSVVSNHGGTVLAAGQTSLSADGQLVAKDGGAIAEANGNLIADAGGSLASDHGAGIVANNSGGLVANNGGGVIANNAGNLVGKSRYTVPDGGGRKLLADAAGSGAASTTGTKPSVGTVLPAAGVEITATSLSTGQLLQLGTDAQGKPVYAIYTNLAGAYTVYLPASVTQNVLISARVPQTTDPRQAYDIVAPPQATHADVTEDTGLSTRQLRVFLATHILQFWTQPPAVGACMVANAKNLKGAVKAPLLAALGTFQKAAAAHGLSGAGGGTPAAYALALRCADALLARTPLDGLMLSSANGVTWGANPGESPEPITQALTECFTTIRTAAQGQLAQDPHYFEHQADVVTANACAPGRYTISRPSDASAFVISEYLTNASDPGLYAAGGFFADIGARLDPTGVTTQHKLIVISDALGYALFEALVLNQHGENDAIAALVNAYDPAASPPPGGWPESPPSPCPRPNYSPRGTAADCAAAASASGTASPDIGSSGAGSAAPGGSGAASVDASASGTGRP